MTYEQTIVILSHVIVALFIFAALSLLVGICLDFLKERRLAGRHPVEMTAAQILAFSNITTRPLEGQGAPAPASVQEKMSDVGCDKNPFRSRFEQIVNDAERVRELLLKSCNPDMFEVLENSLNNHVFHAIRSARDKKELDF